MTEEVKNIVRSEAEELPSRALNTDSLSKGYPVILGGDHAEFEREHADTPPKERPDWPLPSFDAMDWAKAFCRTFMIMHREGHRTRPVDDDEGLMVAWFANALMRGFDERAARPTTPDWRPIETAPRDGTRVLLFAVPNEVKSLAPIVKVGTWKNLLPGYDGWRWEGAEGPSYQPTHWMPLPPLPSEERLSSDRAREAQRSGATEHKAGGEQ